MAKLNVFLRQLAESVGLKSQEVDAVLGASTLSEIEFPDTAITTINTNLMTVDKALADPRVVKKARTEAKGFFMDLVDDKIKGMLALLPETTQKAVKEEADTLKKIDLIKETIMTFDKTSNEKADAKVRKTEEELRGQIAKLEQDIVAGKTAHQEQIKGIELDTYLRSQVFAYEIEPKMQKFKDTIADGVIKELKGLYKLQYDGNKRSVDLLREVEGTLKDVYEDGTQTKLLFKTALDRLMVDYTVKNNNDGGAGGDGSGGDGNQGDGKRFQSTNSAPTHRDLMLQAHAAHGS